MLVEKSVSALPENFLSAVSFAEAVSNKANYIKSDSVSSQCMEASNFFFFLQIRYSEPIPLSSEKMPYPPDSDNKLYLLMWQLDFGTLWDGNCCGSSQQGLIGCGGARGTELGWLGRQSHAPCTVFAGHQ